MINLQRRHRAILRRLAAAVLLRAIDDAQDGDLGAARWLVEDGFALAELLGIDRARLHAWRRAGMQSGRQTLKVRHILRPARKRGGKAS